LRLAGATSWQVVVDLEKRSLNMLFTSRKRANGAHRFGAADIKILTADNDDELRKTMPEADIPVINRVYVRNAGSS
jgi:hypothetical protein